MKKIDLKEPKNKNYCATVVKLDKFEELANCDNVKHALIFGNKVIITKEAKAGDIGIFLPVETKLSEDYLKINNMYRKPELNQNSSEKGYFEENGRIKCMKFRGHKSEGLFMPLSSLTKFMFVGELATLQVGDEFDEINGINICEKYVPKHSQTPGSGGGKQKNAVKRISRLVDNQFRLHTDTENLRKNVHKLKPTDLISITYKLHGTSFVVGNVLVKPKRLNWWQHIISTTFRLPKRPDYYDLVYSSRRVVKNEYETQNGNHYYKYDLWAEIKEKLKDSVEKGITIYGEAVGFLKDGAYIQQDYDYGCKPNEFAIYVYRITTTNVDGKVMKLSATQCKEYCSRYGLNYVPELYFGRAGKLFPISEENHWHENFLKFLEEKYLDKDCHMCKNKVPLEGIVVEKDSGFDMEAFKLKSFNFLERESKQLDKGVQDIETQQSESAE